MEKSNYSFNGVNYGEYKNCIFVYHQKDTETEPEKSLWTLFKSDLSLVFNRAIYFFKHFAIATNSSLLHKFEGIKPDEIKDSIARDRANDIFNLFKKAAIRSYVDKEQTQPTDDYQKQITRLEQVRDKVFGPPVPIGTEKETSTDDSASEMGGEQVKVDSPREPGATAVFQATKLETEAIVTGRGEGEPVVLQASSDIPVAPQAAPAAKLTAPVIGGQTSQLVDPDAGVVRKSASNGEKKELAAPAGEGVVTNAPQPVPVQESSKNEEQTVRKGLSDLASDIKGLGVVYEMTRLFDNVGTLLDQNREKVAARPAPLPESQQPASGAEVPVSEEKHKEPESQQPASNEELQGIEVVAEKGYRGELPLKITKSMREEYARKKIVPEEKK